MSEKLTNEERNIVSQATKQLMESTIRTELTESDKEYLKLFFDENFDYIKHADVPQELIDKYTGVLPEPILEVWRRTGFGIYVQGFLQFVNPDEWEFVFDYIDNIYQRSIVVGITALGDILLWDIKNKNSSNGNHIKIVFVNDCKDKVVGGTNPAKWLGIDFLLDRGDENDDEEFMSDFMKLYSCKNYFKVRDILPPLKYGECYGYTPIPALGGKKTYKTLQVVDAKTYVDMIGQATGKIIDLYD